eukprot:3167270-Rhodomonas_salina.3
MSTTIKRDVAIQYSGTEKGRPTIFEIEVGQVDRGASLSWVSQVRLGCACCARWGAAARMLLCMLAVEGSRMLSNALEGCRMLSNALEWCVGLLQRGWCCGSCTWNGAMDGSI